jgi:hypothetical protein
MKVMVIVKATKNSEAGLMPGEDAELEIRPVFEADDFGAEFTPELRAQEDRLRAEIERQKK